MRSNQMDQGVASRTRRSFLSYQQSKSESIIILKHIQGHTQNLCIIIQDSQQQHEHSQQQQHILSQQRNHRNDANQFNNQAASNSSDNQIQGASNHSVDGVSMKKGRFSSAEQKIITNAVGQFLAQRQISYQDFLILLNKKNVINTFLKKEKFFNILANKLPGRTPFCCYRFVKRQFNERNRKGKWSKQEEERLMKLVQKYGHKWTQIGEILGRTSDNVFDKFKALGSENISKRSKTHWQLRQYITLLVEVNKRVSTKFLNNDIEKELQSVRYYNALQSLSQRKSRCNTQKAAKPFTQLAMRYVGQEICRVDVERVSWSVIAGKLKKRSLIDCKNKFMQLFQFALKRMRFDDRAILQFVERQKVEEERELDWYKWCNESMVMQQAKNRFNLMKKSIANKSAKRFSEILNEMKLKLNRRNAID